MIGTESKAWYTTVFTEGASQRPLQGLSPKFTVIDDVMAPSEWKETGNTLVEFT